MAEVSFEHVGKVYARGDAPAVVDFNLDVRDGEFLVLVGPSGCGKSTSLRMVAGLEIPTSGRIRIGGRDVTNLPPKDRDIAMVFQNYALYPHMTVKENLSFALKLRGMAKAEIECRVASVAATLGLGEYLKRLPKALSALQADTTDDLTTGNLLWLAMAAWRSGVKNIQSVTLPGQGDTVYGASYYLLDRQGVADTVNAYCNPYTRQVAAEDLNIAE